MNNSHALHDVEEESYSKTLFGFWVYILTDFIMFATIFATYVVLQYGASERGLFHLPFTFLQTMILLFSTFTVGLAGAAAQRKDKRTTIALFGLTFLLGMIFMGMQLAEFNYLARSGYSWHESAFLSAFFTLVGTHALHMLFALLWVLVLIPPVLRYGLTPVSIKRLTCLRMFWQFLNIIWILIFTIVYLMGSI